MKKVKVIKSDHDPIKVGDNVLVSFPKKGKTTTGGGQGNGGNDVIKPKKPKAPTTKDMLKEILTRLDKHDKRFDAIETTLGQHSADIQVIKKHVGL
jgi:hypothetical protein